MTATTDSAGRRGRLVWILVAIGAALRIAQYLANRSLWLDEAYLAPTILERSWRGLWRPPEFGQIVPAGFLMLEHAATSVFGRSEYALRLVPLLAGLAALLLFRNAAMRFLAGGAVPLAVAFFALGDPLIYYASEVKQYATDVAVALGVLLLADRARRSERVGSIAALAAAGVAAIWISHPAVFVLAAAGTVLAAAAWRRRNRILLAAVGASGALWVGTVLGLYVTTTRTAGSRPDVLAYWATEFFPFPPKAAADIGWLPNHLGAIFGDPLGFVFRGLAILAFLVGAWAFWKSDGEALALLLAPLGFALAASAARMYPFSGRLLLFLVPGLVILIARGAETMREALRPTARVAAVLLIALLLFHPVVIAAKYLVHPRTREEIRSALADASDHREPGDRLYVYPATEPVYRYYAAKSAFRDADRIAASWHSEWSGYRPDFEALRGRGRVWLLISHTRHRDNTDDEPLLEGILDSAGRRLAVFRHPGASAALYDFGSFSPDRPSATP